MPIFENKFAESKGKPINYNGQELILADKILVNKSFSGHIRLISTNSEWRQGVHLKADGKIVINSAKASDLIIWQEDMKEAVHFQGSSKSMPLFVWNVWDTGNGVVHAWHNGAAMIRTASSCNKKFTYHCNDGHPDENFDDIVFEVVINQEKYNLYTR